MRQVGVSIKHEIKASSLIGQLSIVTFLIAYGLLSMFGRHNFFNGVRGDVIFSSYCVHTTSKQDGCVGERLTWFLWSGRAKASGLFFVRREGALITPESGGGQTEKPRCDS